jgi:hypothetical protein
VTRASVIVVEFDWRLGFGFEAKLVWGDMGEVHPSLCRSVGVVRKH